MYAAIAGLKTHMQNLNVIGNNIANVNTYGYKASRAVFKTSLYTSLRGGSNGTVTTGGTNPSQIGYGSAVSSVDVDMSSGNYAVTGISTDLMLDGDGFFLVGTKDLTQNFTGLTEDMTALTSFTLTRVGDFEFRADGYFGKNDGNVVYGFLCTGIVTEKMILANPDKYQGMKVGDPIFSDQLVPIRYPRMQAAHYYRLDPETGKRIPKADDPTEFEELDPNVDGWDAIYNPLTGQLRENIETEGFRIAYPNTYTYDEDGKPNLETIGEGENAMTVPTESGPLHDAGYSDDLKDSVLEYARFNGISVDPNTGIITATNSDTQEEITIGCIAIGKVTNPNGVTNLGDNYYKASAGSGKLTIGISGGNAASMGIRQINRSLQKPGDGEDYETIAGLTAYSTDTHVISNGLEMSKTDLAQEISMMILTQRGYQANTRIITVTDSMLEELVNMKR